jgi:hypothetical protein
VHGPLVQLWTLKCGNSAVLQNRIFLTERGTLFCHNRTWSVAGYNEVVSWKWRSDKGIPHSMWVPTSKCSYRACNCCLAVSFDYRVGSWPHSKKPQLNVASPCPRVFADCSQDLPLPENTGGIFSGYLTYYSPGLGYCGITSTSQDLVCAISGKLFGTTSLSPSLTVLLMQLE